MLATTKLSSKGQVVIPEEIRIRLNLHTGDQFVVLSDKDVIIFKVITKPSLEDFDDLIHKAKKQAKRTKLKKSDVKLAITKSRLHK